MDVQARRLRVLLPCLEHPVCGRRKIIDMAAIAHLLLPCFAMQLRPTLCGGLCMPRPSGGHGLTATHAAVARTNTAPHACCCNAHQSCQLSCDAQPKAWNIHARCRARKGAKNSPKSMQAASVTHTQRRTPVERIATDCSAATEAVHCPRAGSQHRPQLQRLSHRARCSVQC